MQEEAMPPHELEALHPEIMSDVTPDPVEAGQQYAMKLTTVSQGNKPDLLVPASPGGGGNVRQLPANANKKDIVRASPEIQAEIKKLWDNAIKNITTKPMEGIPPQKAEAGIDPALPIEDQLATINAQKAPNLDELYKINPKAFEDWLKTGPLSKNIEDRRDTKPRDKGKGGPL